MNNNGHYLCRCETEAEENALRPIEFVSALSEKFGGRFWTKRETVGLAILGTFNQSDVEEIRQFVSDWADKAGLRPSGTLSPTTGAITKYN